MRDGGRIITISTGAIRLYFPQAARYLGSKGLTVHVRQARLLSPADVTLNRRPQPLENRLASHSDDGRQSQYVAAQGKA